MNESTITINQNSGVTRVAHGAAPVQLADTGPQESSRVYGGATRISSSDDAPTQSGTARYTVGQDASTSSVMATLQSVNGKQTVELVPGVPGSRTFIRQALADGLIEPVGNGQFRDKGQASGTPEGTSNDLQEAPPEVAPVDPGKGVFDAGETEDWNAAIEPLSQHSYDAASASVTVAVLSGSDNLDRAAANLAEQAAIAPALAAQFIREGHDMYERIVAKAVATEGVSDKAGFYEWLRQSKGRALQSAIQSLTQSRDVGQFRTLAAEYSRHSSPQSQSLKSRMR